jgi:hypothetical protein
MKNQLLFSLLLLIGSSAFSRANAQVIIQGVDVNTLDSVQYIIIRPHPTSKFIYVSVDYGQYITSYKNQRIQRIDEQDREFNGIVHALNFLARNGWEYTSNTFFNVDNGGNENFYILKRTKNMVE